MEDQHSYSPNKIAWLSQKYDALYAQGQALLDEHRPCNIQLLPKGYPICAHTSMLSPNPLGDLCCSGCRHLGSTGCTVKALACKLWLCNSERRRLPELEKKLEVLRRKARSLDLFHIRASKEETFESLYGTA